MKFTTAINFFLSTTMMMSSANAAAAKVDATGKVWAFASSGIHVFTADGSRETLHRHQDEVCQATPTSDDPGILTTDCRYVNGVDLPFHEPLREVISERLYQTLLREWDYT